MRMIKVYPCPKCRSDHLLIKGGTRVECLICWSTAAIPVWNEAYREGVRQRAGMRREERKKR